MTIFEVLKEYWSIVAGFVGGILWVGVLNYRVNQVEKKICIDPSLCEIQRSTCRAIFDSKLEYGSKEFEGIKKTIEETKLAVKESDVLNERRHTELIAMIMSLKK